MDVEVSGKLVCVKGTFASYKQPQIKAALKALGAKVVPLNRAELLFVGARATSYANRAQRQGIPVYDAAALDSLISAVEVAPPPKKAEPEPAGPVVASSLTGKNVVLGGKLATMNKATVKRLLTQAGATLQGKVNGSTHWLIHNRLGGNSEHYEAIRRRVAEMSEQTLVAELLKAGIGTKELADADAKFEKHDKALLKAEGRGLRAARKAREGQVKAWGLSLGALLHAYLRVFAQRPDVHVRTHEACGPGRAVEVTLLNNKIPRWALALFDEVGRTSFCWVFADQTDEMNNFSEGYRGGLLRLPSIYRVKWHPRPESWNAFTYEADCMVDNLQAEASTYLRYEPGVKPKDATLVFDDADDPMVFDNFETYLTLGARRGFAWYWPNNHRESVEIYERLYAASMPRSTPEAEVVAALQERGLSEVEARGIVAWLGEDAVILLPSAP